MSSSAGAGNPEERRAADLADETRRRAEDLAQETTAKADSLAQATAAKAFALAASLDQTLVKIAERLDRYSAFGRRSRQIIIALAVSFALDITLTVVLSIVAIQAAGTAITSAQLVQELHVQQTALHAAQLTVCANGNRFRADQNVIWRRFIAILTTPTATSTKAQVAKADKLAAQFLAYVGTVNHPVDCAALYRQ
jgi:hypothetical protein